MPLFGLGEQAIIKARDNIPHFIDAYGTKFEILWSAEAIEFMNKGVNKAKALKDYIKLMNLEPSEVAVVGDSGNDVPLFEEFENSFVMKNAPEEVRKNAKTEIEGVFSLEEHIY